MSVEIVDHPKTAPVADRRPEEVACRKAIAAGYTGAWAGLGWLLAKQPGGEREAVAA